MKLNEKNWQEFLESKDFDHSKDSTIEALFPNQSSEDIAKKIGEFEDIVGDLLEKSIKAVNSPDKKDEGSISFLIVEALKKMELEVKVVFLMNVIDSIIRNKFIEKLMNTQQNESDIFQDAEEVEETNISEEKKKEGIIKSIIDKFSK